MMATRRYCKSKVNPLKTVIAMIISFQSFDHDALANSGKEEILFSNILEIRKRMLQNI